jgi:hypothetical protein
VLQSCPEGTNLGPPASPRRQRTLDYRAGHAIPAVMYAGSNQRRCSGRPLEDKWSHFADLQPPRDSTHNDRGRTAPHDPIHHGVSGHDKRSPATPSVIGDNSHHFAIISGALCLKPVLLFCKHSGWSGHQIHVS